MTPEIQGVGLRKGRGWVCGSHSRTTSYAIPEGKFSSEVKEADMRVGLEAHPSDNLAINSTQLIFQEEIILEQRKVRGNDKKCLAKMDKDGDLKNRVRIEVD
jgi:hypothetical protein